MGGKLTRWIFAGALAGIAAGWAGHQFSGEPYGIVFPRGDAPLAEVVHEAFRGLAASAEIRAICNKWFMSTPPSGYRLGVPMSVRLERSFELLGLPSE